MPGQSRQLCQSFQRSPVQHLPFFVEVFHLASNSSPNLHKLRWRVVRLHELNQGLDQGILPAVSPQQVVDVVEPFSQVVLLAPGAAAGDLDDASF